MSLNSSPLIGNVVGGRHYGKAYGTAPSPLQANPTPISLADFQQALTHSIVESMAELSDYHDMFWKADRKSLSLADRFIQGGKSAQKPARMRFLHTAGELFRSPANVESLGFPYLERVRNGPDKVTEKQRQELDQAGLAGSVLNLYFDHPDYARVVLALPWKVQSERVAIARTIYDILKDRSLQTVSFSELITGLAQGARTPDLERFRQLGGYPSTMTDHMVTVALRKLQKEHPHA